MFRFLTTALVSGVAALLVSGCSGGLSSGAPAAAPMPNSGLASGQRYHGNTPTPEPSLPPEGLYDQKCEPKWILQTCEQNDLAAAKAGIKYKISFIGLSSTLQQFRELLKYDERIGVKQFVAVESADFDGLEGTKLIDLAEGDGGDWPSTCKDGTGPGGAAKTNKQFIRCIHEGLTDYPAFGGWYLYDEPGCPDANEPYCWATLAPAQDINVTLIASYIHSIDRRPVIGANGGGAYSQYCKDSCVADHMHHMYKWLTGSDMAYSGGDYYPVGCPSGNNCDQSISDLDENIPAIVRALSHSDENLPPGSPPSERLEWVEQAFNWSEEAQCPPTTCSFPTEQQMQQMRDVTLWYSARAGNPVSAIWWFSQTDLNCQFNPVQGCDPAARWSALTQAVNAPYPTKPPD